jgi:hypothetical protein
VRNSSARHPVAATIGDDRLHQAHGASRPDGTAMQSSASKVEVARRSWCLLRRKRRPPTVRSSRTMRNSGWSLQAVMVVTRIGRGVRHVEDRSGTVDDPVGNRLLNTRTLRHNRDQRRCAS